MKIYTRKGDDGTTGLLFGARVPKSSELPTAYGTVDETQAVLGVARAASAGDDDLAELREVVIGIERDLYVLMAELATAPANRHKLTVGQNLVTPEMVTRLEVLIDDLTTRFDPLTEFVLPGEHIVAAHLDVARTVARRAERDALGGLRRGGGRGHPDRRLIRPRLPEPSERPAVDHGALGRGRLATGPRHHCVNRPRNGGTAPRCARRLV